jgi:hypothetical protein
MNLVRTVRNSTRRDSLAERIARVDPANRSQVEQMKREIRKKIEKYPERSFGPIARVALHTQNYELARYITANRPGESTAFFTFITMSEYHSGNFFELAKHFYDTGNQDQIARYMSSDIDMFITPFYKRPAPEIFDGRDDDANALLLSVMNRMTTVVRQWPNNHIELCIWLLLRANEFGPDAFKLRAEEQVSPEFMLFFYIRHIIITLYTQHVQGNVYEGQIGRCRDLLCEVLSYNTHLRNMVDRLLLQNNLHIDPMSICLPVASASFVTPTSTSSTPTENQPNIVGQVAPIPQIYSNNVPMRLQEVSTRGTVQVTERPRSIFDTMSSVPPISDSLSIRSHPDLADLTRYNSWEKPPPVAVPHATVVPERAIAEREQSNPDFHVSDPAEPGVRLQKRLGGYLRMKSKKKKTTKRVKSRRMNPTLYFRKNGSPNDFY